MLNSFLTKGGIRTRWNETGSERAVYLQILSNSSVVSNGEQNGV